jgi:hypothetical protein
MRLNIKGVGWCEGGESGKEKDYRWKRKRKKEMGEVGIGEWAWRREE